VFPDAGYSLGEPVRSHYDFRSNLSVFFTNLQDPGAILPGYAKLLRIQVFVERRRVYRLLALGLLGTGKLVLIAGNVLRRPIFLLLKIPEKPEHPTKTGSYFEECVKSKSTAQY
jgi:hypothetical protein